ncbi:MAG TPA: carboxypeptidase regulatory-like domain-containing protein [Bryobacteraceae bacterium]|nr:carboxypeptidase regulatory-like domain-containing protein [Bryobacteraceae bacterium]
MTWLWRICFSSIWLLPSCCATVAGSVVLTDSHDPGVRHRRDFRGVVVWLEPASGHAAIPASAAHKGYTMRQKDKHFEPHVLAVPVGGAVDFPNDDPIFHNVFSNYSGQIFDLSLYKPYTSKRVTFTRAGIVRLFCNIHPTMSAVIAVLDTPWFAVTGASGTFEVRGVPPGKYTLHVFHERATDETLQALERPVSVENGALALPAITISETGYIPAPHMNKWGKDYPPVIDDQPAYRPNP